MNGSEDISAAQPNPPIAEQLQFDSPPAEVPVLTREQSFLLPCETNVSDGQPTTDARDSKTVSTVSTTTAAPKKPGCTTGQPRNAKRDRTTVEPSPEDLNAAVTMLQQQESAGDLLGHLLEQYRNFDGTFDIDPALLGGIGGFRIRPMTIRWAIEREFQTGGHYNRRSLWKGISYGSTDVKPPGHVVHSNIKSMWCPETKEDVRKFGTNYRADKHGDTDYPMTSNWKRRHPE